MTIPAEHLATAYQHVANANNYLVGILARDGISAKEYDAAEQILITRQNNSKPGSLLHKRLEMALDVLAYDRKRIFDRY